MATEELPAENDPADPELAELLDETTEPVAPETAPETPVEAAPVEPPAAPVVVVPSPVAIPAPIETTTVEPIKTSSQVRLAELDAKIDDELFDANSKDGKAILKEHSRVAAVVESEPIKLKLENAEIWQNEAATHQMPVVDLQKVWRDVKKTMPDKFKNDRGAIEYAYNLKLDEMKSEKAKPKPEAEIVDPPVTQKRVPVQTRGGAVSPGTPAIHRPPAPIKDPGEAFDKSVTREDLNAFVN